MGLVASEECMVVIQVCNKDGKRFRLFNFNIIKYMQYSYIFDYIFNHSNFFSGSRRERKRLKQQALAAEQANLANAGIGGIGSPGSSLSRDERKGIDTNIL